MSCNHPLKGFPVGLTDSGKTKYMITSYAADHVEVPREGSAVVCYDGWSNPNNKVVRDFIEIPCGKCIACRLDYSRAWADRCMLELRYHKTSYFVTLTYDNDHIHVHDYVDSDGVVGASYSLCKKDLQDFWKRLRNHQKVRYYACGEYGDTTQRPHYHAIVFGLELDDLVPYRRNDQGYWLYNSQFLTDVWSHGHVVIGEVTWDTCAYTARYILKKQYGKNAEIYTDLNIQPEFTTMSLKPAIGRRFYDDNKDLLFDNQYISVATADGGRKIRSCRYYDRLYDIDEPEKMAAIRDKRKTFAMNRSFQKMSVTDKDYMSMLQSEEDNLVARIQSLKRKEI